MPELPEVESLRRSLEPALLSRAVASARVIRRDMLVAPGDPTGGFSRSRSTKPPVRITPAWLLSGMRISRLTRHGKQLALETEGGTGVCPAMVVQLGMTGAVTTLGPRGGLPAHTHAIWRLDNHDRLAFSDARRFGVVRLLPGGTREFWEDLGPDALTVRGAVLAERLARTARPVKAALLDQGIIAGVGNIYADESLFAAGIHPESRADRVPASAASCLAAEIRKILRAAISKGGSTIRDYRDSSGKAGGFQRTHKVYGRAGEACPQCGHILSGFRVAQRATVVCERCQPLLG